MERLQNNVSMFKTYSHLFGNDGALAPPLPEPLNSNKNKNHRAVQCCVGAVKDTELIMAFTTNSSASTVSNKGHKEQHTPCSVYIS